MFSSEYMPWLEEHEEGLKSQKGMRAETWPEWCLVTGRNPSSQQPEENTEGETCMLTKLVMCPGEML